MLELCQNYESSMYFANNKTITKLVRALKVYTEKPNYEKCLFVTITTCQKVCKLTDSELNQVVSKWCNLMRKKMPPFEYVKIVERQKNFDLHFHIMCFTNYLFDIPKIVSYFNKKMQGTGTNVFNVSKCERIEKPVHYMLKYMTKDKRNIPYSIYPLRMSDKISSCHLTWQHRHITIEDTNNVDEILQFLELKNSYSRTSHLYKLK